MQDIPNLQGKVCKRAAIEMKTARGREVSVEGVIQDLGDTAYDAMCIEHVPSQPSEE